MLLRRAEEGDVGVLLGLINAYADRGLLLRRSEESLRARLDDFLVAEVEGTVIGCGALTELGPGLGEVRSLAVREEQKGRGIGRAIAGQLFAWAEQRGFREVLALTRRVSFFEGLGYHVTQRERFLDKLITDCQACPLNICCDETAMVRAVMPAVGAGAGPETEPRAVLAFTEGAPRK